MKVITENQKIDILIMIQLFLIMDHKQQTLKVGPFGSVGKERFAQV